MNIVHLEELMVTRGGSVSPSQHPDEVFELYSIPSYDRRQPEILQGKEIGSSKKCVLPGDVLLSRIVPHIRRAWVVNENKGKRQIASGEWIIFRGDSFDANYLRHFLLSDLFHQQYMKTVSGVGGSLLRARPSEVGKIKIPLPPLEEQKRIAAILDKADAIRKKRQRAIEMLDEFLRATFLDMFGDTTKWVCCPLPDILFFQEGPGVRKWQFRDRGIKLINVRNIVDGKLVLENTERFLSEEEALGRYKHFLVEPGDLVMATSGVTWGKTAWVEKRHLPLCMNTSMIRFRPLDSSVVCRAYMRAFLDSDSFTHQIDRLITGSAQPNFGPSHLKQVEIPIPPIDLQHRFAEIVKSAEGKKAWMQAHLAELDICFASLQTRAFQGEL